MAKFSTINKVCLLQTATVSKKEQWILKKNSMLFKDFLSQFAKKTKALKENELIKKLY